MLKAVIPELVSSKFFLEFGNDTSSGIQFLNKQRLFFLRWIPDEAFHEILKKNFGKANSGMTRI